MQHCLICGAASWGPATVGLVASGKFQMQLTDADLVKWRQCDSCGTLANAELIEQETAPRPDVDFGPMDALFKGVHEAMRAPSPTDRIMEETLGVMKSIAPLPATRLERLVVAVTRSSFRWPEESTSAGFAAQIVDLARALETEMDKVPE